MLMEMLVVIQLLVEEDKTRLAPNMQELDDDK
jgi:hypothetical protein